MEPTTEVFISNQNQEQGFLMELLRAMSTLLNHGNGSISNEIMSNLVSSIFDEFVAIYPEPIFENNGIIIRWSEEVRDENGNLHPITYELNYGSEDITRAITKKRPQIRERTEHLASYRKIKADDPLLATAETCSICFEQYQIGQFKRVLDKCAHVFHKKCVDKWFVSNIHIECPLCRTNYNKLDNATI